jgi:hypothetical protein
MNFIQFMDERPENLKNKSNKRLLDPSLCFEFKLNFQTTQGWQISEPILKFWGNGEHHY